MKQYRQYPLAMWLRGLSIGIFIAVSGLCSSDLFPISFSCLIICWVVAGIYNKYKNDESEHQSEETSEQDNKNKIVVCPYCGHGACFKESFDDTTKKTTYKCAICNEYFKK